MPAPRASRTSPTSAVPVAGRAASSRPPPFFEWRQEGSRKVKYRFSRADEDLFCVAGLYDTWRNPDGGELRSCTIITTTPNNLVAAYHNRMPVILHPRDEQIWLDPAVRDVPSIKLLLTSFPAEELAVRAA